MTFVRDKQRLCRTNDTKVFAQLFVQGHLKLAAQLKCPLSQCLPAQNVQVWLQVTKDLSEPWLIHNGKWQPTAPEPESNLIHQNAVLEQFPVGGDETSFL